MQTQHRLKRATEKPKVVLPGIVGRTPDGRGTLHFTYQEEANLVSAEKSTMIKRDKFQKNTSERSNQLHSSDSRKRIILNKRSNTYIRKFLLLTLSGADQTPERHR